MKTSSFVQCSLPGHYSALSKILQKDLSGSETIPQQTIFPTDISSKRKSPERIFSRRIDPRMISLRTDIFPTAISSNHIFHFRNTKVIDMN